jgi:dTDP-4-dehydrorhamnose 3,5-epimerase-like enzyme
MQLCDIDGLVLIDRWFISNGGDSSVVPFPTMNPVNVVFHGHGKKFEYGHFGIHVGVEDRLTFFGNKNKSFKASFIDCREDSETWGVRFTTFLEPNSHKELRIPPGVAHTFEGLEGIYTINAFKAYLPEPAEWLTGESKWTVSGDIVNIPITIADEDLPKIRQNKRAASRSFYKMVSQNINDTLVGKIYDFPLTETITFEDSTEAIIKFRKVDAKKSKIKAWESIEDIEGLGWERNIVVGSEDESVSGFVILNDSGNVNVIDHGEDHYKHDAYGIHLAGEDRLTFVGSPMKKVKLTLVDCRKDSKTLHKKVEIEFSPTPFKRLVIPAGIAHAFDGLEDVYTINRPLPLVNEKGEYPSGPDVIDWPITNEEFPVLVPNANPAPEEIKQALVNAQRKMMDNPSDFKSPFVLMAKNDEGEMVRVAIKEPV